MIRCDGTGTLPGKQMTARAALQAENERLAGQALRVLLLDETRKAVVRRWPPGTPKSG